jgi:hypothetical protein
MANEFKHLSVGGEITQAEYEAVGGHVLASQAIGDIIYASSTSQLSRLGIGSTNDVLVVTGGIPAWDSTWSPAGDITLADTVDLLFGTGSDAGFRWSTGDASNHSLVLGLDNTGQQLHITDQGAIATDWARSAGTHPEVSIHSNTTPATDYLTIGNHDGTTASIDVVGGTTLDLRIAGTDELQITAAGINTNGGTITGTTISATLLTASISLALATGATVTGIDNGSLGTSATLLATQGAIKTYVDALATASDLDFQGDSGGALSIDLDSETLDIAGGTGIDTVGGTNTLTVNIDSTVTTLAGSQTLTNKTLTAPVLTAPVLGTPASGVLTNTTGYTGDSSLVTTGVLNSGSINTSFGTINNGASAITTTGLVSAGSLTVTGTTTLNGNLILGDAAADTLTIAATIQGATPLAFEGGTANGFETSVAIADPSADRTITFPDATLTVNAAGDISGTTLASNVVTSSLTAVATIGTGVWAATDVAVAHGGTGASTATAGFDALSPMTAEGDILYGGSSGTVTKLAKGSDADVLTLASGIPSWATPTTGDITGVTAGTGLSGGGSSGSVTLNVEASQTQITAVGDLGTGSITSNFGTINNGSSTITTTGAVATGALTPSSIAFTGNLYLTGTLTTASNTNNYMVRFNEADSSVTASAANSGTGASGYAFVAIDGEAIAAASSYTFAESSSLMITGPPTAGTNMTLTQTFALNVVAGDVSIAPTAKLFLDGGSNTYIYEESGDDLHIVVGGVSIIQIDQDGPHTTIQGPLRLRNIAGDGNSEFKQSTGNIQGTTTTPVNLGYDLGGAGGDTAFIYVNSMRTDTSYHGNGDLLFVHDNQIVSIAHVGDGTTATYAMSGGQVTIAFSTGTWDTNWWILDPGDPG